MVKISRSGSEFLVISLARNGIFFFVRLAVGGWWLVVGGWWLAVGSWWLAVGSWWFSGFALRLAVDSRWFSGFAWWVAVGD
jgi:hypothetical protein